MSDRETGPAGKPGGAAHGYGEDDGSRIDVSERGGKGPDGEQLSMDRRLFVQLLVFTCPDETVPADAVTRLGERLSKREVSTVIYEDVSDPRGIGVLTFSEDPAVFVDAVRPAVNELSSPLRLRPEMTMLGRSYAGGHETDLTFWLLDRPRKTMLDEAAVWAVWYPLRRTGAFAKLEGREQAAILREHAIIGRAYGQADLAHDVRLACHGLDQNDNEFVVGLLGRTLHPLSHVVQAMRKTRQTSEFIEKMGPFFVGRAVFRHAGKP